MLKRPVVFLLLSLFISAVAFGARAGGLPLVVSTTVNSTLGTVTVTGQNFGSSPIVTLDDLTGGSGGTAAGGLQTTNILGVSGSSGQTAGVGGLLAVRLRESRPPDFQTTP
jgi:hypothetical protein